MNVHATPANLTDSRHSPPLRFKRVSPREFHACIRELVMHQEPRYRQNLELKPSYERHKCWLMTGHLAGFAVTSERELINVFSRRRGCGTAAMRFAVKRYPNLHLNCFAGFHEHFYRTHGFEVIKREANHIPGGPDVLWMRRGPAPK